MCLRCGGAIGRICDSAEAEPALANTARLPHGEWDAWAVWNLKARFLLRGAEDWTALFSPALPHPGYPLMLPGTVARLWMWLGTETPATGAWVAATFTYATPVVSTGAVAALRGWGPELLTGCWSSRPLAA